MEEDVSPMGEEKLKKGVGAAEGEAAGGPKDANGGGILLAHDEEEEEEVSLGEFSTDEEDLVFCEVVAGVLACEAIHLSATPALVSCDGGVWGTSTLPSIPYPELIPPPLPAPIQRHQTKAQNQPPRARCALKHRPLNRLNIEVHRAAAPLEQSSKKFEIRIETTPHEKRARHPFPLP